MPTINGTEGSDTLNGTNGGDTINGLGGDDTINGAGGNDTINGGSGLDVIRGGPGADSIDAGEGNDQIWIDGDVDVATGEQILGGVGNDALFVHRSGDTLRTSLAGVTISGVETLISTIDTIVEITRTQLSGFINLWANLYFAESGAISLGGFASNGRQTFYLNDAGNELDLRGLTLTTEFGFIVRGSEAGDTLFGSSVGDNFYGESGDDFFYAGGGGSTFFGGEGDDTLVAGNGSDSFLGGPGHDTLIGSASELNGTWIDEASADDRIIVADAVFANFGLSLSGNTLSFSGGAITFSSPPQGRFLAAPGPSGGVVLIYVENDPANDFNGDGRSDILLQSTSGAITVWSGQSNGSLVENSGLAANALDANWKVAGLGDFNGDGRDDILWRHTSGVIGEWLGQTGVFTNNSGVAANPVDNGWSVVGIADYNGDGRDDILWRHSTGEIGQWLAQSNGGFINNGGAAANLVDPSWTVVASGDFNGDGRADILWRHSSGVYAEWQGSTTGKLINVGGVMAGSTGSIVGSGDFNGDGRDDVLVRNPTTGLLTNWLGQGNGQFTAVTPSLQLSDLNWKIVAIGDYNGDGRDDLVWKHSSGLAGQWIGAVTGNFAHNGAVPTIPNGWAVQSPELFII